MFRHILLPTDGSPLSRRAVTSGIELARSLGARVTACHAASHNDLTRVFAASGAIDEDVARGLEERFKKEVASILDFVETAARAAGVPCQVRYVNTPDPFEAIIETALRENCDLIFMASHGRSGARALLLGSETSKVLTHCRIPVLVYR